MANATTVLEIPATITERGQTTVPTAIRKILKLGKRGHIVFRGLADGTVMIANTGTETADEDPVLGKFLNFLARDMENQPDRIQPVSRHIIDRAKALVEGIEVDLDSTLPNGDA